MEGKGTGRMLSPRHAQFTSPNKLQSQISAKVQAIMISHTALETKTMQQYLVCLTFGDLGRLWTLEVKQVDTYPLCQPIFWKMENFQKRGQQKHCQLLPSAGLCRIGDEQVWHENGEHVGKNFENKCHDQRVEIVTVAIPAGRATRRD